MSKWVNTLKLYTLKALFIKNWFYFLSSDMQKVLSVF